MKTLPKKELAKEHNNNFPQLPDWLATLFVALTMVIMAYSFLFHLFPILIFLGIWFGCIYYKKTFMLRPTADMVFVFLIPLLCCYSSLWSDFPKVSLYAGAGLISMVSCVIIMARLTSMEAYMKGVTLGATVTLIASLMNAHAVRDEFSASVVQIGLFGSKNEAGFFAEVGIYASLLVLFSKMVRKEKIFFGLLPLAVCLLTLIRSKSASSDISLLIAVAVGGGAYFLHKLTPLARVTVTFMGILSLLAFGTLVTATDADILNPVLKVFGKDSTLTGRTYLWQEGINNGMKRPILGYGYFSFWQPGRPEAEHYWQKFEIPGKTGFHFHNLFIQTFVDMGFLGLSLVISLILCSLYKSFRRVITDGLTLEAGFALGISVMFLIRGFVEVDLFGPFGLGPMMYFTIIPRLAKTSLARYREMKDVH